MATFSDPIRSDPASERAAWGDRTVGSDVPQIPQIRQAALRADRIAALWTAAHTAAHYTIAAVDIVGFGDRSRNGTGQLRLRHGLYAALRQAFDTAGIPWERCRREDRGDGALILAPADLPKTPFADRLPDTLADALAAHNRRQPPKDEIRLRLALHAGEVFHDEHGVTSTSLNHAFRILEAEMFKAAFAESQGILAVISSGWFYDEVIWQSDVSEADSYQCIEVTHKETTTLAWIRVIGDTTPQRSAVATA